MDSVLLRGKIISPSGDWCKSIRVIIVFGLYNTLQNTTVLDEQRHRVCFGILALFKVVNSAKLSFGPSDCLWQSANPLKDDS